MDNLPGSLSFGSWTALGIPASWRSPVRCSFPGHARPVLLSVRTLNSTSGSGLVHRDSKYEEGRLTGQAASVLGVGIKVLPMANHATTKRSNRQILLFIVAFVALGDGFNVGGHGLVNAINAWRERKQLLAIFFSPLRSIEHDRLTFMPHVHLGFHCFEVIGLVGLDLAAHSLATPLPEAIEFSIHCERVLVIMDRVKRRLNKDIYIASKRVCYYRERGIHSTPE